jgi:hypothetical protein
MKNIAVESIYKGQVTSRKDIAWRNSKKAIRCAIGANDNSNLSKPGFELKNGFAGHVAVGEVE